MNSSLTFDREKLQQLFQYAAVLCDNRDDAYDLLQIGIEAFLKEARKGKSIDCPLHFVKKIIRNRFIDLYRYKKRWDVQIFEEQSGYDISPLNIEGIYITQQTLDNIWSELSPDDREILYYWAVLGYSTDQACKLLDIPRGTFLSRIHRMRKKYRLDKNIVNG